jgi:cell wall-associated NlpC family hydrolase
MAAYLRLTPSLCLALEGVILGIALLLGGCASAPPYSASPVVHRQISTESARERSDVVLAAMSLLDVRYKWGGRGPATGFDCSGLVRHVFAEGAGRKIKGNAAQLAAQSTPVASGDLQPGDLVFFNTLGPDFSHVGIYIGSDKFIHASNERTGVRVDHLSNSYYAKRFEGGRSLLD